MALETSLVPQDKRPYNRRSLKDSNKSTESVEEDTDKEEELVEKFALMIDAELEEVIQGTEFV